MREEGDRWEGVADRRTGLFRGFPRRPRSPLWIPVTLCFQRTFVKRSLMSAVQNTIGLASVKSHFQTEAQTQKAIASCTFFCGRDDDEE